MFHPIFQEITNLLPYVISQIYSGNLSRKPKTFALFSRRPNVENKYSGCLLGLPLLLTLQIFLNIISALTWGPLPILSHSGIKEKHSFSPSGQPQEVISCLNP